MKPTTIYRDMDRTVRGYPLASLADEGYNLSNVAHEFEVAESRLDLTFESGAAVHIVWPEEDAAFFWIEHDGGNVVTAADAKRVLSRVGLVPTLTPLERDEKALSAEHLLSNVETKLASRHFRNNLRRAKSDNASDFAELLAFMLDNTPEISKIEIEEVYRDGGLWIYVYFWHPGSRVPKELFWAGDGLQIWLQILFHLWRARSNQTVILDEPDVFLHPDLQRRLVRAIEDRDQQTIIASHSAEVAGESSASSILWIDRSKGRSKRLGGEAELEQISALLGSAFNLSLARALRAKTALFVEGQDMKVLRVLARRVGAPKFVAEDGLAAIAIGGFSHWQSVEAFSWIKSRFVGANVRVRLLLDRDYRGDRECTDLVTRLAANEVLAHVWERKELENYLLEIPAIQRVSGLSTEDSESVIDLVLDDLRLHVFGQFNKNALRQRESGIDESTAHAEALAAFEFAWSDRTTRLRMSPAKEVISGWNGRVREHGGAVLTASKLAQAIRLSELSPELVSFIREVEAEL